MFVLARCLLLAIALCCSTLLAGENPTDLDLFLFIGQSNMASRAPIAKNDTGAVPGVLLLNKENQWEPAAFGVLPGNEKMGVQGYNRFSALELPTKPNGFSSAFTFAQELLKQKPTMKPGFVLNAIGGTRIAQWKKGGEFFNSTVTRTKIAMQSGKLRAILWHQGESDAGNKDYLPELQQFVADLREALGVNAKDVPFIAGQVLPMEKFAPFNEAIVKIADTVPNSACVSSEGTTDRGDKLHFNAPSQQTMGTRYAQAYLNITGAGAR